MLMRKNNAKSPPENISDQPARILFMNAGFPSKKEKMYISGCV